MVATTTLAAAANPPRFLDRIALVVSAVCAPPVLAVPIALMTALRDPKHPWAVSGSLLLLTATAVVPSVYIYREYRRGEVHTLELTTRAERRRPTTLAAVSAVGAAALLFVVGASQPLRSLAWATAVQLSLMAAITRPVGRSATTPPLPRRSPLSQRSLEARRFYGIRRARTDRELVPITSGPALDCSSTRRARGLSSNLDRS